MKNQYRIEGESTAIIIIYKKQIFETYISTSDLPRLLAESRSWNILDHRKRSAGYRVYGRVNSPTGEIIKTYLSRFLVDCVEGLEVDHRDNDSLNHRRDNLRVATKHQNQQNRAGAMRNSKSGIRGVSWCSKWGWRAQISFFGKQRHLGWFKSAEDADVAVKAARAEFYPFSKEGMARQQEASA